MVIVSVLILVYLLQMLLIVSAIGLEETLILIMVYDDRLRQVIDVDPREPIDILILLLQPAKGIDSSTKELISQL